MCLAKIVINVYPAFKLQYFGYTSQVDNDKDRCDKCISVKVWITLQKTVNTKCKGTGHYW